MEKPGWVPVVLSGAFPRGTADAIAITTIAIASVNYLLGSPGSFSLGPTVWFLSLTIAFVSVLASRSDASRKLREELALVAYGGSSWQILLRYFVRGLALTVIGVLPLIYVEYTSEYLLTLRTLAIAITMSMVGGLAYASASLSRIRSEDFVEHYKG